MRTLPSGLATALRRPYALCSLFLLSALALSFPLPDAHADPTPATILIGGRIVPFEVKPFVGSDGQIQAPVDAVQLLGAKFVPNSDGTVGITAANGHKFNIPYTIVQGRYCVAFQKVAQDLGGTADWQSATATLTVRAKLQMVRQDYNELTIFTSYPIYYSVKRIDSPERLYVDLFGLDLATTPANIPNTGGSVTHIRSGQINYQTVRITIDLKQGMPFRVLSGIQTNQVKVALNSSGGHETPILTLPEPVVVQNPMPQLPINPSQVTITSVNCKVVSPALTQVTVTTTGAAKYRTEALDNPNRLAFDLAGAVLEHGVNPTQTVDNSIIKAIRIGKVFTEHTSFGRVVLDLSKMVGFSIDSRPANGGMTYLINVITGGSGSPAPLPSVAIQPMPDGGVLPAPVNGSLAGKLIVIDPGHGGQDSGAPAELRPYDVYEKNITLAIGRRVRDVLAQNGATVLMTRTDDSFPSLMSRPLLANEHHADYFISIHADSSVAGRNTLSGTTVYFHAQNSVCRQMAADIGRRISQTSGIAYNGIKSDTIRFRTGFAVLRASEMPAV
ncbi:MAG: N-acetylmuramoyl-L-alanine amidase, partial [Armatimonadota bacterium]|nr:N-acetylmuramoyl-L-alanine amidase [Armatimonadota bacterium]